ncbi:hypothetical protein [Mycolicibacterium arseniciresistens]|uniref:SMODS-associated and fused to various effectors domain-containing protein n=1 Tax=Mycolicibacterium arseniciresistens TaxID=3062257 RepID=A0ABT8UPM6_9MYCO|nr:hypothetical protein [Mycolicibacterium arseniciresistens]MDO3639753.1 hypothetical protein [Mycolicibacterium arseniciresistens]
MVGYESRAVYASTILLGNCARIVAAPFETNKVLSYSANQKFFESHGTLLAYDHGYRKELLLAIEDALAEWKTIRGVVKDSFRICVDVSSMTRTRLADTMLAIYSDFEGAVEVDWIYAPAKYSRGLMDTGAVRFNDAIPGFEGWGDPGNVLHAIVGLGLEGELALGVLDDLEVTETITFEPFGFHIDYDRKIARRNENFVAGIPPVNRYQYDVTSPFASFLRLAAVVETLTPQGRVVLLPLGPKIFAVMCLLLGLGDQNNVTVWRLSADKGSGPIDRVAAGPLMGLTAARQEGTS